jgi:cellulose synthase/poly-beta-1,6-N-acetylglucosamine synthase-like glycosyltransferase
MAQEVNRATHHGWLILSLVVITTLFISYFWLNAIKDLVYTLFFYLFWQHRLDRNLAPVAERSTSPRVSLVYCTCNDFDSDSLLHSMQQQYDNLRIVILDDSTQASYMREVDSFARCHGVEVVRRKTRHGFKAGNLNHYLEAAQYDYFAILDSDEIIPPNFVTRCLDYFNADPRTGIVQANHIATRNRNGFMSLYAIGVDSHWPTYQSVKDQFGFLSLLGHGAMVSRGCYDATHGFPNLVAEDLCFSIEARDAGYYTTFAPDILCQEEYPVDYLAFKKRHTKWTQGNVEFIKRYTGRIIRSRLTWFEKLDILLFAYSLPLTFFFFTYVAINVVLLPLARYGVRYPAWLLLPTLISLVAPMLNDILYHARKVTPRHLGKYLLHSMLLYGSLCCVTLKASLVASFGRAVFYVTPKHSRHVSLPNAIRLNYQEIIFALGLCAISLLVNSSLLPVILIAIPAVMSVYLTRLANREHGPEPAGISPVVPDSTT